MKLSGDAAGFLERCSSIIGTNAADTFSQHRFCECFDLKMESPIEHILYIALLAVADLTRLKCHDVTFVKNSVNEYMPTDFVSGLSVDPQVRIENYRVDFLVSWYGDTPSASPNMKRVVVECDSQQWHDRTEIERRYEKRRDRDLLRLGYQVLRFTGKEIKDEPFRVAIEILNHVTGRTHVDVLNLIEDMEKS